MMYLSSPRDLLEPVTVSLKEDRGVRSGRKVEPRRPRTVSAASLASSPIRQSAGFRLTSSSPKEFIDIVLRSQKDLPYDLQKEVIEFESSEKLNPPTENNG